MTKVTLKFNFRRGAKIVLSATFATKKFFNAVNICFEKVAKVGGRNAL